eukprot:4753072-Pyramimonas_sp.AAC.1
MKFCGKRNIIQRVIRAEGWADSSPYPLPLDLRGRVAGHWGVQDGAKRASESPRLHSRYPEIL